MNLNKELHEALGYCWHEPVSGLQLWLQTSNRMSFICSKCGERYTEGFCPDYVADPRLVIREIMKREDWPAFCDQIGHSYATHETKAAAYDYIYLFYILDTTGKLAQLALDWLREQKGGNG